MDTLQILIKNLSKLPGIGRKSAARIAYFLLKADSKYVSDLGKYIYHLKDRIITCDICGNYTEVSPCEVCRNPSRDKSLLCIVEQSQDVLNLEESGEFKGLYHVLQGVISPLDGYRPEDLPVTEDVAQRIVRLPFYADLAGEGLDYCIESMHTVLDRIYG